MVLNEFKIQDKNSRNSDDSEDSNSSSSDDETQCEICQRIFLDTKDLDLHIRSRRLGDKRLCLPDQQTGNFIKLL